MVSEDIVSANSWSVYLISKFWN